MGTATSISQLRGRVVYFSLKISPARVYSVNGGYVTPGVQECLKLLSSPRARGLLAAKTAQLQCCQTTRRKSLMSNHPKDHLQWGLNVAHRMIIILVLVLSAATHMSAQTSSGTSSVGGTVRDTSARIISHA